MNIKKILVAILAVLLIWNVGLPLLGFGAHLVVQLAKIALIVAVVTFGVYMGKDIAGKMYMKYKK